MTTLVAVFAGLLGLVLGSFANVVIYRVPAGLSVVQPRSACPNCGTPIAARHNIPVVSWLWLRRRCATCHTPISARYPIVELGMGVAFFTIVAVAGLHWHTLVLLTLAAFSIILSAIDLDVRRLPTKIVVPMAVSIGGLLVLTAALEGRWDDLLRAVIGAAILGAFYFGAFMVYPGGMGFGDVTVAPVLGAVLAFIGWPALVVGGFSAFVWGGLVGIGVMVATRRTKKVAIPFGPWMFLGAWTGIVAGAAISDWYLSVVFAS